MNMDGSPSKGHMASTGRFILYRLFPVIILLITGAILLFASYLTTPHAAAKLSTILSRMLDLPVTISSISLSGDTLVLKGIEVGNPPEFPANKLVSVAAVRLAPGWSGLLMGRRNLRVLGIDGARIDFRKGSDGVWNFEKLRQKLFGGKGGGELFIDALLVTNGDILVNGHGLRSLSLKLRNVATKGTAGSSTELAFDDESGNRFTVTGSFRAGAAPEAELALEAPALAFAGLASEDRRLTIAGGRGTLGLHATLRGGVVRSSATATFQDLAVQMRAGGETSLSGSLQASTSYDMKRDELTLENGALILDDLLDIRATGGVHRLKGDWAYDLAIGIQRLDIARGAVVLPGLRKKGLKTAGTVTAEKIRISGGAQQLVASVDGVVSLRNMMLARNGRLLLSGVGTDLKITTSQNRIRLAGELSQKKTGDAPLLERIAGPYAMVFSSGMKPDAVDLPGFTAIVLGMPLSGNFSIRPKDKLPFSISLQLPESRLKAVSYGDFVINAATVGMSLDLRGAGIAAFSGSLSLSLDGLNGSIRGEPVALGNANIKTDFKMAAGRYTVSGNGTFARSLVKGVPAEGRCDFSAADGLLQLDNGAVSVADTTLNFSRLITRLPQSGQQQAHKGQPLDVQIAGGAVSRGEFSLTGIAADLHGDYGGTAGPGKIAGTGKIAAEKLIWRNRNIGAPVATIALSRSAGQITLAGNIIGGTLGGAVNFIPFAVTSEAAFDLSLKGAALAQLAQLADNKGAVAVTGGQLTMALRGSYSGKNGVTCSIKGDGDEIAVSGAGGKGLLAHAGLKFDSTLSQGNINLSDAQFRIGTGATVQLQGEVTHAFSPQREGKIAYNLSRSPLERIVDPIANALPRLLQEASLFGDMATAGTIGIHNDHTTLQGSVQIHDAGIDAGTGKLQVAGVSGSIPYSLGFPARRTASPEQSAVLTRASYEQQLALFKKAADTDPTLKIGRIAFGPLEFGATTLRIKAAEGIIEALSIKSSLTTGKILGQGYVSFAKGVSYGGDLLLSDLSLQQICALFPNIRGYVTGRVDGIAMFEGQSGGSLNGYTYIWTRPGAGEKMLVSKDFLQKLAGKNLQGFLFRTDHPFDKGEVMATLEKGYLTFDILDIANTNFFGVRDLQVTVTETQNRIALDHLLGSISQAVSRGKNAPGQKSPGEAAPAPEFKWGE